MIKSFEVLGLQGKWDYNFTFNPDLNIFTGKNGSGKTTLLKLLWYCLSGNVGQIHTEMTFRKAVLETSSFKLEISMDLDAAPSETAFSLEIGGQPISTEAAQPVVRSWPPTCTGMATPIPQSGQERNRGPAGPIGVLFPRSGELKEALRWSAGGALPAGSRPLIRCKRRCLAFQIILILGNHHFVASISTQDIVALLTSKFAEISQRTNSLHRDLSESITKTIRDYELEQKKGPTKTKLAFAETTLIDIQSKISQIENQRNLLLNPFVSIHTVGHAHTQAPRD